MTERNFHQIAHELLDKEVEVITIQGNYSGRLLAVGKDVLILHSRSRMRHIDLTIRLEVVVAIYRVEPTPRGPFGFNPGEFEAEEEHRESSDNRKTK